MNKLILALVALVMMACNSANGTMAPEAKAPTISAEELAEENARLRARLARIEIEQEARANANDGEAEPEPPPVEKPAEAPPAQPAPSFQQVFRPQMALMFNPTVGGFTTQQAGYVNLNPHNLPCQQMCVTLTNSTIGEVPIAVFVNLSPVTVLSGFRPIAGAARVAKTPDGKEVYGYISILPHGQQMQFRVDHKGMTDIAVTAFTTMNDGWMEPTFYNIYKREFPRRGTGKDGWEKTVYSLDRRI